MNIFRLFRSSRPAAADPQRVKECLENIKRKIAERSGISDVVELEGNCVAFSGTADHYDLFLSLDFVERKGKSYLYAYMEDRLEWYEWDYKSQDKFEYSIVEFICEKINRTVKTITEQKKHKYIRVTEYYLDKETEEWILMSDDKASWLMIRPFITEDSVTEVIKEYHL